MAFKISQVEPVQFGDKQVEPELDTEKKLRLQKITFATEAEETKADKVLSSCFPADEEFVLEYLAKCPALEKQRLQAYLVGGEKLVRTIDESLVNTAKGAIKGEQ
ncbi:MAG: hypothetical protein IIW85_04055 [Bacteroidaceae bacterium]|nr:hypothetical protein [Bacteroidaceae bacterium]